MADNPRRYLGGLCAFFLLFGLFCLFKGQVALGRRSGLLSIRMSDSPVQFWVIIIFSLALAVLAGAAALKDISK